MDVATLHVGVSVLQVFVFDSLFVVKKFFSNAFHRDRISIFICKTFGMQNVILQLVA